MLSIFDYTEMREDEVAHLYWSDVRWNEREIGARELVVLIGQKKAMGIAVQVTGKRPI